MSYLTWCLWVLTSYSCMIICIRTWHNQRSNSRRKLKLDDLNGQLAAQTWTRLNMSGQAMQIRLSLYSPSNFLQCIENCLARRIGSDTTRRDPYLIDSMLSQLQAVLWCGVTSFVVKCIPSIINLDQFSTYIKYTHFYILEILFSVSSMCEYFHNTCVAEHYYPNYKPYTGSSLVIEGKSWVF